MSRIGWIDASAGVSGDMLLGACFDAGVDPAVVRTALAALQLPERIDIGAEPAIRGALGGTRALVGVTETHHHRTLPDVLALLAHLAPPIAADAARVFRTLAEAEARVHRIPAEQVHFHEVGALDSIADVIGVVVALRELAIDRLVCSPIALGAGTANTAHGAIPVPVPAVLELLRARGAPGFGGPVPFELATPTGVALLTTLADAFGPMPALRAELVGTGAGGRDPAGHTNVTRLVIGDALEAPELHVSLKDEPAVVIEANVDDLDPRLWPQVLAVLFDAGASDVWLTPILMKKGRPAHTLSVLVEPDLVDVLQRLVLIHTSTIGVRRQSWTKIALPREILEVRVHGRPVRVKVARLDGAVVNAEPEYEDVAALAVELGLTARDVLALARAEAAQLPR